MQASPLIVPISISNRGQRLDLTVIWDQDGGSGVHLGNIHVTEDVNITEVHVIQKPKISRTQRTGASMGNVLRSPQCQGEVPVAVPGHGHGVREGGRDMVNRRRMDGVMNIVMGWMRRDL